MSQPTPKISCIEIEEFIPGRGWEWRRLPMPSEWEASKYARRKLRSPDVRNLCVAVAENGSVYRNTFKSRWGHKVVAPRLIRLEATL